MLYMMFQVLDAYRCLFADGSVILARV
jgi:hypothetical protein